LLRCRAVQTRLRLSKVGIFEDCSDTAPPSCSRAQRASASHPDLVTQFKHMQLATCKHWRSCRSTCKTLPKHSQHLPCSSCKRYRAALPLSLSSPWMQAAAHPHLPTLSPSSFATWPPATSTRMQEVAQLEDELQRAVRLQRWMRHNRCWLHRRIPGHRDAQVTDWQLPSTNTVRYPRTCCAGSPAVKDRCHRDRLASQVPEAALRA
jgi:hypothetical protein